MKSTLNVFLTVCYDWIMYSHQILIGARHGVGDGGLLTVRDRGSRSLWPMLFFLKSFLKFILISDGTESSLLSRLSLVRVRRGCSLVLALIVVEWASLLVQTGKNLPAMQVGPGWIRASGRSPGGGHDNPLQCSCLENSMDRGA